MASAWPSSASFSRIQSYTSVSIPRRVDDGRHEVRPFSLVQSVTYHGMSPGRSSCVAETLTTLPVISAHSSVSSRSEAEHAGPPPTLAMTPAQDSGSRELDLDEADEVVDVEQVAHLLAAAAEADVGERPPEHVREHPVRHDALVDLAHLPRAGDDAAPIDDGAKAEGRARTPG